MSEPTLREVIRKAMEPGVWRDDRGVEVLNLSYVMGETARLIADAEQRGAEQVAARVETALHQYSWWHTGGTLCTPQHAVRAALKDPS